MAKEIMIEKQWDYQETAGFVSKKSIIEGILQENAKTDKAQSEEIAANADAIAENAEAISKNAEADEKQGEDIAANSEAISENAKLDEKQGEDIAANAQAIADEMAAREEVDAQVWEAIAKEASARTEVEGQIWDAVNTLAEENNKVDEDQWTAINGEISARTEVEGQIWDAIAKEASARTEVESELWSGIAQEASARTEVDTQLWEGLATETERAKAAEEELSNAIAAEVERANGVESELWNGIAQEASARTKVEGQIWDAVNAEISARTEVEGQIWEGLNNESAARETVDNEQWDVINAEIERAKAAEEANAEGITKINETLDTLLETKGVDKVIDTFKDVEEFLEGITDAETLTTLVGDAVKAETDRAEAAEKELSDALAEEVKRAEKAEDDEKRARELATIELNNAIATNVNALNGVIAGVNTNLVNEINRAVVADQTNANAISAEEARAMAAEKVNADNISANANAITAEESRAKAAETANAEAIDTLNNNVVSIVNNLNNVITTITSNLQTAIANEQSRAEGAESVNANAISAEEARAMAAEKVNADNISAEQTRAEGVESGLQSSINANANAISANANAISTEVERAQGVEDSLDGRVSKLESASTANAQAIEDEETRAMAAEKVNADAIAVLNGEDEGSVKKTVADEIAKVVAEAPEAFDTLKEISDWISSHEDSAAAMNTAIADNKTAIESEVSRAESAETALSNRVTLLEAIDHEAYIAADSELKEELEGEINEATKNMIVWEANGQRKKIVLDNYENILGKGVNGSEYNLAMVSKWNVADYGSKEIHMELNTMDNISVVAGESKEVLAYKSDVENAKSEAISAATYDDTVVKGLISTEETRAMAVESGLQSSIDAIEIPTKVSAFENDANYALKSEVPSIEGLASEDWVESKKYLTEHQSLDGYATEAWVGEQGFLTEHQSLDNYALKSEVPSIEGLATEESVNTVAASVEGLNVAVKALKAAIASEIKSDVILDEELKEGQFAYAPENGDLYIINSEVSGAKGSSNGKVMFTASTVNISNVTAKDITGTYNLFEQGQTVDKDIEELTVANLTVDGSLQHNVVNAYNLAEGAVITLKDIKVDGIDPSKTNLVRISNYKNVENVTINFENVSVNYMEGFNEDDKAYFGFLLYQAVNGKDTSYAGTSCVNTWKVNFKNCYLNGKKVESLNFGTVDQVAYTYNFNAGGSVTSIDDTDKSAMTVSFE